MNKVTSKNKSITKFLISSNKYGKFEVIIDTEDWDKVKLHNWHINKNGNNYYISTNIRLGVNKRKQLWLHQFLCEKKDGKLDVDHINNNNLDNRKKNLRLCSHADNCKNRKPNKNSISKYKGVIKERYGYKVVIKFNKEKIYVGHYLNEIEAANAYNEAALKYHGQFANLNAI